MMTVVVKLALVLMDFQSILVGPVLLPRQGDSLVDRTEHLLRVPLVEGLQGSVDLVTVIVLSCPQELVTEELFLSLALQVTSQTSVTVYEISNVWYNPVYEGSLPKYFT